jgi:hypothetical protein
MSQLTRLEKRLRLSGALIILGLLIELVTLKWSHPTAFLVFLIVGGLFMFVGIVMYLLTLVSASDAPAQEKPSTDG